VLYRVNLPFTYWNLYICSMVGALLLIGLSLHPWRLLVNRFTIFLGKVSFSVYLLHFYVLLGLLHLERQQMVRHPSLNSHPSAQFAILFLGTLVVVVPLSALTWKFIETPGIHLGRRLIARREGQARQRRDAELVPPLRSLVGTENSPDAQF